MFKKIFSLLSLAIVFSTVPVASAAPSVFGNATPALLSDYEIGLGGNAYLVKGSEAFIDNNSGLINWRGKDAIITTYFRTTYAQKKVKISLLAKGHSTIGVNAGKTVLVKINSDEFKEYEVGEFDFPEAGYQKIHIRGKEKKGNTFGEIKSLTIKGVKGDVNYVRNFENYWGRRGPSVHMGYEMPRSVKIEYFYNEVTVPVGQDAMHTYFMLNGFGQGYCGIQVNSPTERRILFSVWSPSNAQNPKDIPEDQRIIKLRQGQDVHIGEFGNEGSGGQSFLRYMWKAGVTYGVLTRVHPDGNGNTDYTAYFYIPDERKWMLIASFRRPGIDTWYTNAHSFLENFNPAQGFVSREVHFGNQWVCDTKGNWYELLKGRFTCDATGGAKVRMDYTGGVTEDGKEFLLKNCGFFNENTSSGTQFERKPSGKKPPMINFSALEKL